MVIFCEKSDITVFILIGGGGGRSLSCLKGRFFHSLEVFYVFLGFLSSKRKPNILLIRYLLRYFKQFIAYFSWFVSVRVVRG
jgi:hypothetical protein